MNYFQFPWRLLSILILTTSFLAGSIFSIYNSRLLTTIMILVAILLTFNYAHPDHYFYRNDSYYLAKSNFMDGTNSPGNVFNTIWIKGKLSRQDQKIKTEDTDGEVVQKKISSTRYFFESFLNDDSRIIINTAYFPGWYAIIDNKPSIVRFTKDGLIELNVSKGKHVIEVRFTETPIRRFANIISFFSLLLLFIFFVRSMHFRRI